MEKYKKLGKNIGLITIGSFASKMLSFFLIPLYTAILTTSEYGIADLLTTTIQLISPFFTLVISESVMRFALDSEKDSKQVLTVGLFVQIVGFLLMLLFSPLLLLNKDLAPYYWMFIAYYAATTLHSVMSQFVKGIERVFLYSICGVAQTIIFITLNVFFLLVLKIGVNGYLLSLILSNLFIAIILFLGIKGWKYLVRISRVDRTLFQEMLRYSIPMVPNSLSWWISNSSDKYMLTAFIGVSSTGIYSVAQRIPSLFAVISTIFIGAWQISAIEDFGSEDSKRFYSKIYCNYSNLCIILVSGMICFSKVMGRFLFSNDFFSGWKYIPILLFAFMFQAMSNYLGTIYTSAKKTKMLFISTIVAAVSNIIFNAFLISFIEIQGAAIATLISYFLVWFIRLCDSKKILELSIRLDMDILSYLLIIIQIIFILIDTMWSTVASFAILTVIIIINKSFYSIVSHMIKALKQRNRK